MEKNHGQFEEFNELKSRIRSIAQFYSRDRRGAQSVRAVWRQGSHAVSAGAEWVSAHRAREIDLPELWAGGQVWREVQSPLRRHQSDEGGARIRRFDSRGCSLAGRGLGRPRTVRIGL